MYRNSYEDYLLVISDLTYNDLSSSYQGHMTLDGKYHKTLHDRQVHCKSSCIHVETHMGTSGGDNISQVITSSFCIAIL